MDRCRSHSVRIYFLFSILVMVAVTFKKKRELNAEDWDIGLNFRVQYFSTSTSVLKYCTSTRVQNMILEICFVCLGSASMR